MMKVVGAIRSRQKLFLSVGEAKEVNPFDNWILDGGESPPREVYRVKARPPR